MNAESTTPSHPAPRPAHHRPDGGFRNPWPGTQPAGFRGFLRWMAERVRGRAGSRESMHHLPRLVSRRSVPAPPTHRPDIKLPRAAADACLITAIGHSSFLLQVGGLNVLTDPVFVERASPLQWAGPRRLRAAGLKRDDLPPIDLVLQSHDHYDHLDLHTARWLAQRDPGAIWCVPLGVAKRLAAVGVRHLVERDWWQGATVGAAEVACVPAAHFSGRTPFDRDATLWCGWSLRVAEYRIYFVGDTGFHPEFAAIGERLGAWDAILMPVGAYAPRWFMRPVHCDPDDALTAFDTLTAAHPEYPTVMLAMHWGTFELSDEPLDEPVERVRAGWRQRANHPERLWVLEPGETRALRISR